LNKNSSNPEPYSHIGVLGAGSWGTALALVAAEAGRNVTLWAREPEVCDSIRSKRENTPFLSGARLPEAIAPTQDIATLAGAEAILLVAPAQHLRAALAALVPHLARHVPLVLCAKGIERGTGRFLTEVLGECAPACEPAILSGPSFARDVARRLPTAVTVAARMEIAVRLQASLSHPTFRPYASDDLAGVALGGAAKNVYAIGCGIVAGMGLGDSARAALLARSFAELCRLGEKIGARSETLMGLSGLGDLVLTATSPNSRNYAFGFNLGQGAKREDLFAPGSPLAEGAQTAPALTARARAEAIDLPIAHAIADILSGTLTLEAAIPRLMARPLKAE